jgi:hypothetical protein
MTLDRGVVVGALKGGRAIRFERVVDVLVWSAPAVALLVGVASLSASTPDDIGSFGLVQALQPVLYVCLALLTASFVTVLFVRPSAPAVLLAAHVAVLVVLLHGAATIVEPVPRFTPAWLHVGFTDYIARTGRTLPEFDARMSWPGFFALAAMATRVAGLPDAMPLLGWTPVMLNLVYGGGVYLIARTTTSDRRATWLAVWLFYPANWVGQDYFAPQGLNYLFYLAIVAVLLRWFRPPPLEWWRRRDGRWRRRLRLAADPLRRAAGLAPRPLRHEPRGVELLPWQGVALTGMLVTIFVASTVSHQLTPAAVIASVAGLVLVRRCSVRSLPLLMAVIAVAYFSYLTVVYWSGHLPDLLRSVGNVVGTVSAGATERVQGDAAHQFVARARLLLTVVVWCLAGVGAWRRLRRGAGDLALFALAVAPFLVILLQSYGGEVLLRAYLFALPATVVLLAGVLVPAEAPRRRGLTAAAAALLSVGLIGAFYLTRYGNEAFEQVHPSDVQAMNWLYQRAPQGSTLVAVTSNVPWRFKALERYDYTPLGEDLGPQQLDTIEGAMEANPRGAFLILSKAQFVYGESYYGRPPGWGEQLERQVLGSPRFRVVFTNAEAKIFVLARPQRQA